MRSAEEDYQVIKMGRGSSKIGITEIKQMQKALTTAKRNETRLEKEYHLKSGAVVGFDWNNGTIQEYVKKISDRDNALTRYQKAVNQRTNIENRLNKAKQRKRDVNAPLF